MKNNIRITALSLSVLMSAALALAGCGASDGASGESGATDTGFNATGYPVVEEPVTFEVATKTTNANPYEDMVYFKNIEEKTNVHIDWNVSPDSGWNERKGLLFAGDMPDAFYGNNVLTDIDVVKYGSQGLLIPLNDLIEEYAPNLKAVFEENPDYKRAITAPDGNIYALPCITEMNPVTRDKLYINKVWLDQLGLEVPKTLEEFEAVLRAFRDNDMNGNGDPNDEIPFIALHDNLANGLYSMFGFQGQIDRQDHILVKDGQVVYTAMTEPYKESMEYFHGWYEEGLLDPEMFTQDFNTLKAKVSAETEIVGAFIGWSASSTAGLNQDDYIIIEPPTVDGEKVMWNAYPYMIRSRGAFAITSECENPEILMRWMDESYIPENSLQIDAGMLGSTVQKNAEGKYEEIKQPEGVQAIDIVKKDTPNSDGVYAIMKSLVAQRVPSETMKIRLEEDALYAPYNAPTEMIYPMAFFTEEETSEMAVLQTDISNYVEQQYATWIVDGGVEEGWDAYLQKLNDMKIDRFLEIYQAAYDRYMAS